MMKPQAQIAPVDDHIIDVTDSEFQEHSFPTASSCWSRLAIMAMLAIATFFFGVWFSKSRTQSTSVASYQPAAPLKEQPIQVHVVGKVKKPGLYQLPFNARIYQAIEKAGGALPEANLDEINLAAWAEDGSQIAVPSKVIVAANQAKNTSSESIDLPPLSIEDAPNVEPAGSESTPIVRSTAQPEPKPATRVTPKTPKIAAAENSPKFPIDLNRATQAELETLPGIGSATAEKILAYRKERGGFHNVEDLDGVSGIGEKKIEKIRPLVIVKLLPHQKTTREKSNHETSAPVSDKP